MSEPKQYCSYFCGHRLNSEGVADAESSQGVEIVTNAHLGWTGCDRSCLMCRNSDPQLDLGVAVDTLDGILHWLQLVLGLHPRRGVLFVF